MILLRAILNIFKNDKSVFVSETKSRKIAQREIWGIILNYITEKKHQREHVTATGPTKLVPTGHLGPVGGQL